MKFSSPPIACALLCALVASGAQAQSGRFARRLVTSAVDDNRRVARSGNVPPAARQATDLGELNRTVTLDHLRLQLQRSADDQAALQAFLASQQDPTSPNYHKWGTAESFVEQFGINDADLEAVRNWLTSQGLTFNYVTPNMTVDFSGSVGAVNKAFGTSIHALKANGETHFSNLTEPTIPAALAGVVLAPVALHDFKPHRLSSARQVPVTETTASGPTANYTVSSSYHLVSPGDLATIYNFTPLFSAGVSGQGQTIVLLERTNLYNNADFTNFRNTFGLAKAYPSGNLVIAHPAASGKSKVSGSVTISSQTCKDPGVLTGDDGEAALDVEWASAAAPSATIELASCADTSTNFGAFIALENLLTASATPPTAMSLSYGSAESEEGASGNAYISALYQLAAYEGVTLYVSTGDADAAVADQGSATATHGINANALASTVYNLAVGGTDFSDTYYSKTSSYWSSSNSSTYTSALSYISEIPWNNSCASKLIATFSGYSLTYGSSGFCNSTKGKSYLSTGGGSGAPSACATGAPSIYGVVSGTCKGYAKPSWQVSYGVPSDGVRDLPDVSMFAANGLWGHYFPFCYTNPKGGGVSCSGAPSTWSGAGGTSFGAPIWAGIQALIQQYTKAAQGNIAPKFYSLANTEFGPQGSVSCNSNNGASSGSACVFHDVTLGDNDSVCTPLNNILYNCYRPSGTYGVMSTSNSSYLPSYNATTGYDLATGLGTPNVTNLVHSIK